MNSNHHAAVNETRLRVRYAETDQMGVVYHSNHLIWFEVGRVDLLRQLGFNYRDMEQNDGCFIAVVEVRCRYRAPAVPGRVRERAGDGLERQHGEVVNQVRFVAGILRSDQLRTRISSWVAVGTG